MEFENASVFNFEGAIRGMRNPMNSWSKSDSHNSELFKYIIGDNDMKLAQSLIKAGTDHSKFMRQIIVSVDITAPLYWWKEFDTYKVGTVANSTSTMHKLAHTKITEDCFEFDCVTAIDGDTGVKISYIICCLLENIRNEYLKTKDENLWRELIQILPSSWLQKRTVTMSYQNIRAMYAARKNHKLKEWSKSFIEWVDELPYSKEFISFGL